MFLKRFVYVNWGSIPNGDFEFGPVNLFSGGNGSGKTTAADAIQTVMTAAHENLFHYNPGQDESTQRGRGGKRVRTLASYVLGCDDGSYARTEPTDGYIAAVFHPTKDETAEPFTAVVGMRAWLDRSGSQAVAREEQVVFFILQGVELTIDAFQSVQSGGVRHVVLLDQIQQKLIAQFGKRVVERYDQKRAYLRRLYAALRGKPDSVGESEALGAARAFSRFMAYKPVSSINQFVADEVLERKDLGEAIRNVSSQLKIIHGMEREAQTLKDSSELLERAGHQAQSYIESWVELQTLHYTREQAAFAERQRQYLKAIEERDATQRDLDANAGELQLAAQRHAQLRTALVSLEAQRQGVPALQQKDALERERAGLDVRLRTEVGNLLNQDRQLQENVAAVRILHDLLARASVAAELPQLTDMESRRIVQQARDIEGASDVDLPRLLQRDLTHDISMLEKHLDQARAVQRAHLELASYLKQRDAEGASRRDIAAAHQHQRRQKYEHITGQLHQREQEIARLEAKQVVYPSYVERALSAIRAQCPQADARVLCDHIEVTDPKWQAAIEGYLGGARFAILVDEASEAQAIRIVRSMAGRDNRARVLQGARALRDASRLKPPADSIAHVMKFTHKVAEAYVHANYGAVVRVASPEELRNTPRGVTVDGMGSGAYAMFRCDVADADLVFGAAARERALQARRMEVEKLTAERAEAHAHLQEAIQLLETVDRLSVLSYADALAGVLDLHRETRRVEMLLAKIDVSEHRTLDAELERLHQEEEGLRELEGSLNTRKGELQTRLKNLGQSIDRLSEQKESAQERMRAAEDDLRDAHRRWPQFDLEARLRYADQEARSFDTASGEKSGQELEGRLRSAERTLGETILMHNQKCRPPDAIVYPAFAGAYDAALFSTICGLRLDIDHVYNILRNNVLVEKHETLRLLKRSFNDAFVSNLCQEIHQSILGGRRQLEALNKELGDYRFGSDREKFRFDQTWIPEYREYARFFEEVVKSPAIGQEATLFEARLSPKSAQVRDAMMELLLGADEQKSLRELERIADYRNYHRYEIYKEVEGKPPIALSEYGTGSGGQLETPAYIIRAASITQSLRFGEGVNHLRMVLVDEAFSKMDETRSREVIDYLTGALGLQLVFIMPTSKCGPFMDLISNEFVYAKVPSAPRGELRTRVLVDRKQCNRERIGELWARHRRTVREQAELDFMADVLAEEQAARAGSARR